MNTETTAIISDPSRFGEPQQRSTSASMEVMKAGQRQILVRQASRCIGLIALLGVLWLGPTSSQSSFWDAPTSWFLLAITAAAGLLTVIRGLGLWAMSSSTEVIPEPPAATRAETVICCSGGGIKSASFSLGALQQLSRTGVYRHVDTIVGVSGGGYIASAYAALAGRSTGTAAPFAADSKELAVLRRRTDYLASSPRVRFDLFMSMLFGITVNALILAAIAVILAVFISEHAGWTGLLVGGSGVPWTFNPAYLGGWSLLWPASVLVGLSWCWFLAVRLQKGRAYEAVCDRDDRERLSERAWRGWVSSTPNTLLRCGVIYFLFFPAAAFLACQWHNWTLQLSSWGAWQNAAAGVTAFLGFVASVRSTWKGVERKGPESLLSKVLAFFRRRVVPWVGVCLAAAVGYALIVVLTATFLEWDGAPTGWLLMMAAGMLLGLRLLPGANLSSMYPFYRDRLAWAFLQYGTKQPEPAGGDAPQKRRRRRPVAVGDLAGGPELVLCATASVTEGDVVPAGRNGTPFIFSAAHVGLTDTNLPVGNCVIPPAHYKGARSKQDNTRFPLRLKDAVAISGAAIAPLGGREDKLMGPNRLLLALGNVRLGAWVRNPYWMNTARPAGAWAKVIRTINDAVDRTSSLRVVDEAIRTASINSPYLYVHDGGHYDNLGLVEALRRRPARVILLDGTGDPEDQFTAMGDAIATARMDLGAEVHFDPTPMKRKKRSRPPQGWVKAEARYREGGTCSILYVKCVLPTEPSWDLESYRLRNPDFPAGSNKYEMYDEFDFEAYRHLGESIVHRALRDLREDPDWSDLLRDTPFLVTANSLGQNSASTEDMRTSSEPESLSA